MLLPHAAEVSITLRWLCGVYYVFFGYSLKMGVSSVLYIICHISHYGARLGLKKT